MANNIKRYKSKNHVTINNAIMKERDVSLKAKGLFALVMSLPDDWDFSIKGICAITKENYTAVNSAMHELIDAGYCRCQTVKENGKFAGCDYEFSEVKTGSPRLDFPHTENPRVENLNDNNINSTINSPLNKDISTINSPDKKENNKKESIDSKKEKTRFIKPTLEELKEFIEEKKLLHIDAEEYYNYFESVGWVIGKNRPMKSWKASCMTWNNRHKPKASYYDPLPEDDLTVLRFKKWMRDNHGQMGFVEKPLTCEGYIRLQKQYGRDEVINQLVYIDANIGRFKYSDIEASIRLYFERGQ